MTSKQQYFFGILSWNRRTLWLFWTPPDVVTMCTVAEYPVLSEIWTMVKKTKVSCTVPAGAESVATLTDVIFGFDYDGRLRYKTLYKMLILFDMMCCGHKVKCNVKKSRETFIYISGFHSLLLPLSKSRWHFGFLFLHRIIT